MLRLPLETGRPDHSGKQWPEVCEITLRVFADDVADHYHRRRRQDALGRMTPIEFETLTQAAPAA